uniref:Putative secreted protein n=1 Tax=Anopheles triannulatus TaxID=58253 RepID=A0A2M4B5A3_9DIPT
MVWFLRTVWRLSSFASNLSAIIRGVSKPTCSAPNRSKLWIRFCRTVLSSCSEESFSAAKDVTMDCKSLTSSLSVSGDWTGAVPRASFNLSISTTVRW